ncbi:MAG: chemotaxis protein CheR [Candidatus Rokuibacteriota bacterium]|nr:MAG: chemotaxis protein CheR [Candidatus Rokubacteria bacterium]
MSSDDERVEALLDYLKATRGFDFSAYKPSSLVRRIQKRLQAVSSSSYEQYRSYLEAHPEEFQLLFNTILINVTSFFRDPEAWEFLATQVVPRVLTGGRPDSTIRVWSTGCASGEEAYTLAMILAEQLGVEPFRRRVKIYASDVDEDALIQARHATYTAQQVEDVPPELRSRYFERVDDRYLFNKDVRRSIIFGRHDLVQDAPISRVNLLVCRNTLMYFTRETQARVLNRFHFAMRDGGVLFMGRAELLLTHGELFTPIELKWRVFTKATSSSLRDVSRLPEREEDSASMPHDDRLEVLALETDPVARVVVRADGTLGFANSRARTLFHLTPPDVGKPLQDLEMSFRPVELRSLIQDATAQHRTVSRKDVPWPSDSGDARYLDLDVVPLVDASRKTLGVQITFMDVSRYRRLQEELARSKHDLETAYEELQSTNEELETTNEELQSTNEELETMNEELQSTNEELETTNTELRMRSDELNTANAFLGSILTGLEVGVVVVDPKLQVLAWNHRAEDMWGLRSDEVRGRHFMNLDIGLPVEKLLQPVRAVLAGETGRAELTLDCLNRRGKSIRCQIRCTPLIGGKGDVLGAILLMEEEAISSS